MLKRIKVWTNQVCDRVLEGCVRVLLDHRRLHSPAVRKVAYWAARHTAALCILWQDLPQVTAYDLVGEPWRVRVVGPETSARMLAQVLFQGQKPPLVREAARVPRWRLPKIVPEWLAGDVDLVICRKSTSRLWRLGAAVPIQFSMPGRVEQYLDLDVPVEDHLAGRRGRGIRTRLNRARAMGLGYRISHDPADLARFYREMYLPSVSRHGSLAVVASLEQMQAFLSQGALLLITHDGQDVAGSVCSLVDGTCYATEEGVLHGDSELLQMGINAFLYWCSFQWALENGARTFSLGASAPAATDGPFDFKAHWGARVKRWRGLSDHWEVCAGTLNSLQRDTLNGLQMIGQVDGRFVQVWIGSVDERSVDFERMMSEVRRAGLDGLLSLGDDTTHRQEVFRPVG